MPAEGIKFKYFNISSECNEDLTKITFNDNLQGLTFLGYQKFTDSYIFTDGDRKHLVSISRRFLKAIINKC